MNDKFDKWNGWLDVIYKEISTLSIHRYIFWEVQEIVKNNSRIQKPSSFYDFLTSAYVTSTLIGIRKQVKERNDSISFARLMKEIYDTPDVLSRARYVALYKNSGRKRFANKDFDRFAGKVEIHVDPKLVKSDIQELKEKVQICEKYTDMRVAHIDKRSINHIPTFEDIDNCIDLLETFLKKYLLLLRASSPNSILPVWQYNWKEIFSEPMVAETAYQLEQVVEEARKKHHQVEVLAL